MRQLVGLVAFLLAGAVGTLGMSPALPAWADAPSPVPAHQHYLILPDGTMLPIGPDICSNPADAQGFYGFHQNVHKGTPNLFAFQQGGNPVSLTVTGCPS